MCHHSDFDHIELDKSSGRSFTTEIAAKFWRDSQPNPRDFIIVPDSSGKVKTVRVGGF